MPPKCPQLNSKSPERDCFQTPDWASDMIVPFIPKHSIVWEPCEGKGNIVRRLFHHGIATVGTDILTGHDFLTDDPAFPFDCIVTNPPYSILDAWVKRCFELGKPWALLCQLTALGEQGRVRLYRERGGVQVIWPWRRINFETPTGKSEKTGSTAHFWSVWITYGFGLPKDNVYLDPPVVVEKKEQLSLEF